MLCGVRSGLRGVPGAQVALARLQPVRFGSVLFLSFLFSACGDGGSPPPDLPSGEPQAVSASSPDPPDTMATCPSDASDGNSVSVGFSSPVSGAAFFCKLDNKAAVPCASPFETGPLAVGAHSLTVGSRDGNGNTDPTPVTCQWSVARDANSEGTKPPSASDLGAPSSVNIVPGNGSMTLSWTAVPQAVSYEILYNTQTFFVGPEGGVVTASKSVVTTATQVTIADLSNGTKYFFAVFAIDSAGKKSGASTEVSATPVAPVVTAPTDTTAPIFLGLTSAASLSSTQINLAWTAGSDNVAAPADLSYKICQSTTWGACQTAFAATYTTTAGATSYSVTGLTASMLYYFVARAQDPAGNTDGNTIQKSATTQAGADTTPPTFSGISSATAVSSSKINLAWFAAYDGVTLTSALVYDVCQSTTSGSCASSFAATYSSSAGATAYSATGLTPDTPYYFVVRAKDTAGNRDTNTVQKSAVTSVTQVAQAVTAHMGGHSCSLLADGSVSCWGINTYGQLGDGTTVNKLTPVAVSGLSTALAVSGGDSHTCALLSDGTVKCWGYNFYGGLGDGSTAHRSTPVVVNSLSGAVAVAGGGSYTCSLLSDGTVKCWGYNNSGQLGDGTTVGKLTPVAVSSLSGAVAVAGGGTHTCSLLSEGTVKCWGYNNSGQLGDGTTVYKSTPVAVSSLSGALVVAEGTSHTCSLLSDGTVKCWGYNVSGQLGDGTTADKSTPVAASSLSGVVAVAGGNNHTCSLLADGKVKCWGRNDFGQLGDGTTMNKSTPVTASSLSGAVAVSGGVYHTCSLLSEGTVKCWGGNGYGQLGDGTLVSKSTPVTVPITGGALGVISPNLHESAASGAPARPWREGLSGGMDHSCAILSDGTGRCWGETTGTS
ncbi:MAG: fibronectin type III domain-containing protein [Nitrospirae bacterium]|nr:fibronectin type III domain-containing protein [Nitrospirota bacterium]